MTDQHPMFAKVEITPRHRLNREDKAAGTLGDMHRTALSRLRDAGPNGLTWGELGEREGWHHGRVSSVLSDLHREGHATRLAGKGAFRKGTRSSIYVLPEFTEGRDTAAYGGTKASAALKALPEQAARIEELEKELALFRSREAELDQLKMTLQGEIEHHTRTINALGAEKEHHANTVSVLAEADRQRVSLTVALEKEYDKVRALQSEQFDKVRALRSEQFEVDQILGKILDFPEAYPAVSDVDDGTVVTGDHTIVSLAQSAVGHIKSLREKIDLLQDDLLEADQKLSNIRETLETEREASKAARPVMPSIDADERAFVEKVRKAITGKPDTQVQPARVGSLRTLLHLVDRLHKS